MRFNLRPIWRTWLSYENSQTGRTRQAGLADKDAFAFRLAAEEVCTNIIQYGFAGQEPGTIELVFETGIEKARLFIIDSGPFLLPKQAKPPEIDLDPVGLNAPHRSGCGGYFRQKTFPSIELLAAAVAGMYGALIAKGVGVDEMLERSKLLWPRDHARLHC